MEYTHQPIDSESHINSISGYYTVEKEIKLHYKGQDILCIIGTGTVDSSCCGIAGCRYALVPGYISKWKKQINSEGLAVSEVEPVADKDVQKIVGAQLTDKEVITQINFW